MIEVAEAVKRIHKSGGFEMHNLITNSDRVAERLGILIDFIFVLKFHKVSNKVITMKRTPTKRELLSISMSVFDPYGFAAIMI